MNEGESILCGKLVIYNFYFNRNVIEVLDSPEAETFKGKLCDSKLRVLDLP